MKNKHNMVAVAIGAFLITGNAWGCLTLAQCRNICKSPCVCCEQVKTTYNCPSGWSYSNGACRRGNTSAGEDSKGYKANTYGTCGPTSSSTQSCYLGSMDGQCWTQGEYNEKNSCYRHHYYGHADVCKICVWTNRHNLYIVQARLLQVWEQL